MCPDDHVLSSFLDHELPVDSSERVEQHLSGCEDCCTRLRGYQSISHRLLECDEPDVEEVGMRIWNRIEAQAPVTPAWRRWSLRLPVAAATTAVAIAAVFTMSYGGGFWGNHVPIEPETLRPVAMGSIDASEGSGGPLKTPVAGTDQGMLRLALPDSGRSHFWLFSTPTILHETEFSPSAPSVFAVDGGAVTLKIQLPSARYRLVGAPTIWHEVELQTAKP